MHNIQAHLPASTKSSVAALKPSYGAITGSHSMGQGIPENRINKLSEYTQQTTVSRFRRRFLYILLVAQALAIAIVLSRNFFKTQDLRRYPTPEAVKVVELPLPPVAPNNRPGACTFNINPRRTGCISRGIQDSRFQGGGFSPDGNHVVANVMFTGAPEAPDPASIFNGEQLILVKVDGTAFSNGDTWKCLSCAIQKKHQKSLNPQRDYPHVFRSGDRALWGHNILDCNGHLLISDECNSSEIFIYPIYWPTIKNGVEVNGALRELRLHPDDTHLGWSSFTGTGGQNCFLGELVFNPNPGTGDLLAPRYDLVNVHLLFSPSRSQQLTTKGAELMIHDDVIGVGELRGFSGTGNEILYLGPSREANNIDVFAIHIVTGTVRRLTQHPEYADPVAFSSDDEWFVVMDTRGSNRQMFMAGMRHVPPLIDLVTMTVAASTRNNGNRRFFQPILLDKHGDRGGYFGQQLNAEGDGHNGAINDANWNGRADPAFSQDGTKVVYWQTIITGRECQGGNAYTCPVPNTQGQREYRLMVANLTSRTARTAPPIFKVPDRISWALPFPPGSSLPSTTELHPGIYTLRGRVSGYARVQFDRSSSNAHENYNSVAVTYTNFSDVGGFVLNGWENVTRTILYPNVWNTLIDWYSDITQSGFVDASKRTGPGGFHLQIDAMVNIFNATGTLTTTINKVKYKQPANGA